MAKKWFYRAEEVEMMQAGQEAECVRRVARAEVERIKAVAQIEAENMKVVEKLRAQLMHAEAGNELALERAVRAKEDELRAGLIEASEKAAVMEKESQALMIVIDEKSKQIEALKNNNASMLSLILKLAEKSQEVKVVEGKAGQVAVVMPDGKTVEIAK